MELKEKIIKTAYELFAEKGYEKTTVSEIITTVGSSKGGFYHHFKSKDEILEAITMNYINDLLKYYEEILLDNEGSVIDLFNYVFIKINQYKADQLEEWKKIRKIYSFSGNHVILRKLAEEFELVTTKLYTKLILKGIEEGIFKVKYPKVLAELWAREIIRIYRIARKVIYAKDSLALNEFENLLNFNENLINNALGLESNLIQIKEEALAFVQNSRNQVFADKEGHYD